MSYLPSCLVVRFMDAQLRPAVRLALPGELGYGMYPDWPADELGWHKGHVRPLYDATGKTKIDIGEEEVNGERA